LIGVELRAILDFVFPPQCGGCEALGSGLCATCLPRAPLLHRRLPSLDVTALGAYDGGLRRAILALKNGRRDVAEAFALRLAPWIDANTMIVPVPTTAARRRQRGFDGCELIARLACANRASVIPALAQVMGETQRGRGRDARLKARTRFVWRAEQLNGARIVLLDDVVTTGATLEDCAAVVRAAGGIVQKGIVIATA
jgi:predicted amidophosphoribosyltransferase